MRIKEKLYRFSLIVPRSNPICYLEFYIIDSGNIETLRHEILHKWLQFVIAQTDNYSSFRDYLCNQGYNVQDPLNVEIDIEAHVMKMQK